jgi:hypothetical protein
MSREKRSRLRRWVGVGDEMTTPRRKEPPAAVLDDEDVRRRVAAGELVPMTVLGPAPVDPLVMARLRELAARPLRGRGSRGD